MVMQNCLLAFRVIDGKHDGRNLGTIIFEIVKAAGILGRVGEFTFDNASNCDTTMETLKELFLKENIPFCHIHTFQSIGPNNIGPAKSDK